VSATDKQHGRYVRVATLELEPQATREIYLEGVDFPLLLIKQVFVNEDGSIGLLYPVTSDRTLTYDAMTTLYRKRWNVEPYHKSLKQNASLERSPTLVALTSQSCAHMLKMFIRTFTIPDKHGGHFSPHLTPITLDAKPYIHCASERGRHMRTVRIVDYKGMIALRGDA
jgi:hypothetical protein